MSTLGSSFVAPHRCAHPGQDTLHGRGMRVFTVGKSSGSAAGRVGHCTVCCPARKPDPTGRSRRIICSGCIAVKSEETTKAPKGAPTK